MKKKEIYENKKCKEYYQLNFPELTEQECIEKANYYKKSCSWQNIEYYEVRNPELSKEELIKLRENAINNKRFNSPTNILYWQKRYPEKTVEELEELRNKHAKSKNKCNLEYWINKYPEKSLEEVKELHNKHYQSWLSHQEGWGKGNKNCNSKNNSTEEYRKSKSPKCIEFYERKYPNLSHEDHLKLLNEHIEKINSILTPNKRTTNIEYYLNKGMSDEDAKIALNKRQATFSLYKCIEKYGEERGLEIFNNRQKIWNKKLQKSFKQGKYTQSPIAIELFNIIKEKLNLNNIIEEKYIFNDNLHKGYLFDFCLNNKLIEFNGDYWHANPDLYDAKTFIKAKNKRAETIWEYDKIKIETALNQGYEVLTVWENDYKNNTNQIIQKCIEFLKA